jgi:pimeloyl-ACP methyl ester carboxylesterase
MTSSFLVRPEGRLAYDLAGDDGAPLVVAAHGMGANRHAFRALTPALLRAGLRVASVDLRGHGESSPVWPRYDAEAVADDLLALVAHLGGPAVLVGSSISGAAVTIAAAQSPADVAGVVLVGATAIPQPMNPVLRVGFELVTRSPALWLAFYRSLYKAGRPEDYPADTATLRRQLREPGRMAALRRVLDPVEPHWTVRAATVTCPALIVMGTRDPDFPDPAAQARAAADAFTAAEVDTMLVEGAGHYPFLELPATVNPAIADFAQRAQRLRTGS